MTEPHHEPSYYEIALTNRQVVVAFAILLVCLLAAFLSGVWVGRGGAGEQETQVAARSAPQPGAALEEFEFFEEGEERSAPGAAAPQGQTGAPQPQAPTTLREDLEETPAEDEPGAREPAEEGAAEGEGEEEPVAAPPEPRPQPPPAAAEPARAPAGTAVIQVFSSAEQSQASGVRDRLTAAGYKAYLSPVEVGGRTMYRVRIGPFTSRAKAQEVAERVRKSHRLDTWVTE
ncbi:MAG TPA: SPOR domain-containing protein [Thermoanaerobaculia bacterium]